MKEGIGQALCGIRDLQDISFNMEPITKQEILECLNSGQDIKPRLKVITSSSSGDVVTDANYDGRLSLRDILLNNYSAPNLSLLTPVERSSHAISELDHWVDSKQSLSNTKVFSTVLCFTRSPTNMLREGAFLRGDGTEEGALCFCKHKALNQVSPKMSQLLLNQQACQECMMHSIEDIYNTVIKKGLLTCVAQD
jgi:hypothetical protein